MRSFERTSVGSNVFSVISEFQRRSSTFLTVLVGLKSSWRGCGFQGLSQVLLGAS